MTCCCCENAGGMWAKTRPIQNRDCVKIAAQIFCQRPSLSGRPINILKVICYNGGLTFIGRATALCFAD
jgi:hypothetical protein